MDALLSAGDVAAFDAAWRTKWPESRPVGSELKSSEFVTWVRFHSLPESKRYADTRAEYDQLLSRHVTVISELCSLAATSSNDLIIVTVAWSESAEPMERTSELVKAFPSAAYWKSIPYDLSDADYPAWVHLYIGRSALNAPDLRALLLLVADDGTREVIICPAGLEWLYHPYDGGADVIAPDQPTRDLLRTKHSDWLSTHPYGL